MWESNAFGGGKAKSARGGGVRSPVPSLQAGVSEPPGGDVFGPGPPETGTAAGVSDILLGFPQVQ